MLIGKYRVDNLVEASITRAIGGVWPFPFKTAPREGIVQAEVYPYAQASRKERPFLP